MSEVPLLLAGGSRRRRALRDWARQQGYATVLRTDQRDLDEHLDGLNSSTLLIPVGAATSGHRRAPVRVVVGEPATMGELRAVHGTRPGQSLVDVVRRQATLAVDRAERREVGDTFKVPRDVVADITGSARFSEVVSELARDTGQAPSAVAAEARDCLQEMAARHSPWAIRLWLRIGRWMSRAYVVDVDDAQLPRLHELNRHHALVFLPNHRSYLDPIVLRSVLAPRGFAPNHVLGGINLSFWPLGPFMRRTGLVFIRREFRDAPIYRAMLREYLSFLVAKRFNLEWYIEGGRTRSGKLRPPRYGILSYLIDAFAEGDARDVFLVPVSIVYDQQHEVGAISAEEQGGSKSPEGAGWMVRFARGQGRRPGRVHVRFGEPLSLRSELQVAAADDARLAVPKVAFEVYHRINLATPITPTALMTFALLDNDGRALTITESRRILDPLVDYVVRRSLPLTTHESLSHSDDLAEALEGLIRAGVVIRHDVGPEPVFAIADQRVHEAAFYRNTMIHFLVDRAIAEVAALAAQDSMSLTPWDEALRLRDLLKFEFFFARRSEFDDALRREVSLAAPAQDATGLFTAHRVIGPFLEAYGIVADTLCAHDPAEAVNTSAVIADCISLGRQRALRRLLHSPEGIARDLYGNGLLLAGNRGLLGVGGSDLQRARHDFAREIADDIAHIDVIRRMALAAMRDSAA